MKKSLLIIIVGLLFITCASYADENNTTPSPAPKHAHHGPSKAAINACLGKAVADTCTYTNAKGESKSGSCTKTKDGQTLFCKRTKKAAS